MGGPEAMIKWVGESTVNKRIFYKDILPKLIPREVRGQIGGEGGGPMKMVIEWAGGASPNPTVATTTSAIANTITGVLASSEED